MVCELFFGTDHSSQLVVAMGPLRWSHFVLPVLCEAVEGVEGKTQSRDAVREMANVMGLERLAVAATRL